MRCRKWSWRRMRSVISVSTDDYLNSDSTLQVGSSRTVSSHYFTHSGKGWGNPDRNLCPYPGPGTSSWDAWNWSLQIHIRAVPFIFFGVARDSFTIGRCLGNRQSQTIVSGTSYFIILVSIAVELVDGST